MIKFDVFPRDLGVGQKTKQVVVTSQINVSRFENGSLHLCKVPVEIMVHTISSELVLAKAVPEPLAVNNSPAPQLNPDGSFDYVPDVTGGLGPYEFTLTGYDPVDGFEFNQSNGEFSRPPQ